MWDKLAERIDGWLDHWSKVVFNPKAIASNSETPTAIKRGEFFLGTQLLSAFLGFIACIAFFAIYFRGNLTAKIGNGQADLKILSLAVAIFVALNFVNIILCSSLSYLVAKALRSRVSFKEYSNMYFDLSALDPVATIIIALSLLFMGGDLDAPWIGAASLFILCKAWVIYAGYFVTASINTGRKSTKIAIFALGFLPGLIAFNIFLTLVTWGLTTLAIIGFD